MVDFDKGRDLKMWIMEHTGGPAAGGLTVRDVMAITAMGALIEKHGDVMKIEFEDEDNDDYGFVSLHVRAYEHADAMLNARITLPPEPERISVEEAFGLPETN